jgi:hypothetical protein
MLLEADVSEMWWSTWDEPEGAGFGAVGETPEADAAIVWMTGHREVRRAPSLVLGNLQVAPETKINTSRDTTPYVKVLRSRL